MMAALALVLFGVHFAIVFGWRTWVQYRATGDSGFRGISGAPGSIEWIGGVLFVLALAAAVASPIADIAGLPTIGVLIQSPIQIAGVVLAVGGIAATLSGDPEHLGCSSARCPVQVCHAGHRFGPGPLSWMSWRRSLRPGHGLAVFR